MASTSTSALLTFTVAHKATKHELSLSSETPLSVLREELDERTSIPSDLQKLILKGKVLSQEDASLAQLGVVSGSKLMLLGSTRTAVEGLQKGEKTVADREAIRQKHLKEAAASRPKGSAKTAPTHFSQIVPFPTDVPQFDKRSAMLQRLAHDPSIYHIMTKRNLRVGQLTELHPHVNPNLLGLNENAGQTIRLRLLTDDLEGCRVYSEVRRVLVHELTHNVHGPHDDKFKTLNSQMLREAADWDLQSKGSRVGGQVERWSDSVVDIDDHPEEVYAGVDRGGSYVLGGGSAVVAGVTQADDAATRRRRVLEAAEARMRLQEEEIEHACGSGPQAAS